MMNKFYIYRHIRLDKNEVFYIGKGSKPNKATCFNKEYVRAFSTQGRNKIWRQIVSKTNYEVEIMFECDDESQVFQKETELIEFYGRKDLKEGTLANLTFGGEGNIGKIVSEETRKKQSLVKLGTKFSPEANAKKGSKGDKNFFFGKSLCGSDNGFYGKNHTEDYKRNYSYGAANPMFGKTGDLNPFYGKTHSKEFLRRKQLLHSNPIKIIFSDGTSKEFMCVSDAAEYFNCTSENILFRVKAGKEGKFGKFKDTQVLINK